ncbi:efflux RND transporter periplasmic adaptor subunit [Sphingobacterium sp. Mn56C]|uniref:efflux RND transporter periplasmic adaptor subunit n=1 Tax=Sphingobacterium sp. Mn56C TaxID=3395261 RepID=UPI003BD996E0
MKYIGFNRRQVLPFQAGLGGLGGLAGLAGIKNFSRLSALGLLLLFSSCAGKTVSEEKVEVEDTKGYCLNEQLKKSTEILEVSEQPITEQLTVPGKVDYNENDMVSFRSLLEGIVEGVRFELGDYVQKGQVLATIKSTQIQELYQQKRQQQNQIALSQKQVQTKKDLLKDGMISAPELLEAEHELDNATIELERINQSLQLYRATGDGTFQLLAPKNGYVIQKSISPGQSITVDSDPLFSISNLKEVWVMVNIFASNLRNIHLGDNVQVRTIAYPDKFYPGKIDKIYNVFDDNEHVLKARVVLQNQNLNLMPGMSADIIIDKKNSLGNAFAIPNKAIVFSNNKEYIVVHKDDCHLEARKITKIGSNEQFTFIQEKLAPGEKVIGSNALLIFEQVN